MFAFCVLAWVLFRAQSISEAGYVFTHMFNITTDLSAMSGGKKLILAVIAVAVLFIIDFFAQKLDLIS